MTHLAAALVAVVLFWVATRLRARTVVALAVLMFVGAALAAR